MVFYREPGGDKGTVIKPERQKQKRINMTKVE
jgi:hypothetical protein